jgi:hypothetical protein
MVLPQIFSDNHNPHLVIAIDEAHPLSEMSGKGFSPSYIPRRAINAYSRASKGSNWVVFASTTSQVAAFSAPQPIRKYPSIHWLLFFTEFCRRFPSCGSSWPDVVPAFYPSWMGPECRCCLICRLMMSRSSNISPDSVVHCLSSRFRARFVALTNHDKYMIGGSGRGRREYQLDHDGGCTEAL